MKILAIDVILAIGILLNIFKGGDLILRDQQRRWVQDKFESLTLRLEELKPMLWLNGLRTRKAQVVLVAIGLAEFALVALVNIVVLPGPREDTDSLRIAQIPGLILGFLCFPVIFR